MKKRSWDIDDAMNKFEELVKYAEHGEHQEVLINGKPVVYIVGNDTYERKVFNDKRSKFEVLRKRPHKDIDLAIGK